jgi:hypothetical protein
MLANAYKKLSKKEKELFDEVRKGLWTADNWLFASWGGVYLNAFDDDDKKFLTELTRQWDKRHSEYIGFEFKPVLKNGDGIVVERIFADLTERFRVWVKAGEEMVSFNRKQYEVFAKLVPHNALLLVKIPQPDKIYDYAYFLYFVNETDGVGLTYGILTSFIDLRYKIFVDFDRNEYLRKEREELHKELTSEIENK